MKFSRVLSILFLATAGFTAAGGQKTVSLTWDQNPDTNVVGYFTYFGGESGGYTNRTDVGNTNSCTVGGLSEGATYFFVVTARDADGLESDPSNEVAYLVPGVVRIRMPLGGIQPPSIEFPVATGQWYELQATEDLLSWVPVWSFLGIANKWVRFQDFEATSYRQRFYRVVGRPPAHDP